MNAPQKAGPAARLSGIKFSSGTPRSPKPAQSAQPAKHPMIMRRYQIKALLEDGTTKQSEYLGPAMQVFEDAFSAFAHGTLISTPRGQIAIEDLVPGMRVQTADHGDQDVVWIGSMTLMPRCASLPQGSSLTRITADSFGLARPERDLMAGPGARFVRRQGGDAPALVPASALVDGVNAIDVVPPRPVTVYHICLRQHAVINAGGLDSESYHPGPGFEIGMNPRLLDLFLSYFPNIGAPEDFGPLAAPRHEPEPRTPELA